MPTSTVTNPTGPSSAAAQAVGEIRHSVLIRAAPEQVYDAFTTADGLNGWFTVEAESDPRPGGEMTWRWRDWGPERFSGASTVPVLAAERPTRFVFGWDGEDTIPGEPRHLTTVEVDFETRPEGVVVHLRDYGYRDTPGGRRANIDCAIGWGEALTLLKMYAEHGIGT